MEALQCALEIVDRVKSASTHVKINEHQCRRLAEVYGNVGQALSEFRRANQKRQEPASRPLEPLLHVMEVGELLVLEYAGPDWFRSLVTRTDNQEAFEELHHDLRLWVRSLFGTNVGGTYFFELARDAARDREQMLATLIEMHEESSSRTARKKSPKKANHAAAAPPPIPCASLEVVIKKLQKQESTQFGAPKPAPWRKLRRFRDAKFDREMYAYTERKKRTEKPPRLPSDSVEALLMKAKGRKRCLKREKERDAKFSRTMYSEENEELDKKLEDVAFRISRSSPGGALQTSPSEDRRRLATPDADDRQQCDPKNDPLQRDASRCSVSDHKAKSERWTDAASVQAPSERCMKKMQAKSKKCSEGKGSMPANCSPMQKPGNHLDAARFHAPEICPGELTPFLIREPRFSEPLALDDATNLEPYVPEQRACRAASSFAPDVADLMSRLAISGPCDSDDLKIPLSEIKVEEHVLGKGAFSEVRVAWWLGCKFAVKILRTQSMDMLLHEVGIHKKLRHPHIVLLVGYAVDADTCMMVMELMHSSLHDLIVVRRRGTRPPFPLPEAIELMSQIAKGMMYLHSKGLLHGDLKTMNVLVEPKGESFVLKISDFGVSKLGADEKSSEFSGNTGSGFFRAPEVLKGTVKYSLKADIYSFAMTCYEILTGFIPFQNAGTPPSKYDVINGERPSLPGKTNRRLRDLIERCWHGEQETRPEFSKICEDLQDLKASPEVNNSKAWWSKRFYSMPLAIWT